MEARGGPRPAPGTINAMFFDAVERFDKLDALQVKVNGHYQPVSHSRLLERVRRTALALGELGIGKGERVAILSENRPEWAIADYACLAAGVTDVPVYPTLPAEQIMYILRDSGARAIFVSTADQAAKIAQIRDDLPTLQHVIAFDQGAGATMTQRDFEDRGATLESSERNARFRDEALAVRPSDLATLIYTSGTTGEPKGVMLTHDNFYSNVAAATQAIPFTGTDVALSFLPLSHVFERMAGHYLMFATGTSIAYAESVDTVPADLQLVRPTLVLSVPRLYEKMYARVLENAMAGSATKQRIFHWARSVGLRWADEKLAGRTPGGLLAFKYRLASKLVFSKLQARTGGRLRFFVSGGAPLSAEINKFFYAAGLVILEGYGLTETSPVIAVNTPTHLRIGTVGRPIAGVEVAIAKDGEILTRGPHVMQGYYNRADATREVLSDDGWLRTGDIGTLEDGFLRITDRKKDIIVTAGGKNIAPQPLENLVRANEFVNQAVLIGDRRSYPVMLVVPDYDRLEKWAAGENIPVGNRAELIALPAVRAKFEEEVARSLVGLASFETPKKIGLIEDDFTIDRGELTPSLKVRRRAVEQRYTSLIDSLYRDSEGGKAGVGSRAR